MLVIHALLALRRLPPLMLIGLLVMATGGVLDVVIHLGPPGHGAHSSLATEHLAHVVGVAGMSLVLAGLVLHGARRHLRPRADRHGGLDTNAHR
jgi:hypothetical protein